MNILASSVLLAASLSTPVTTGNQPVSADGSQYVAVATKLIPSHTSAQDPSGLRELFYLQLAAGRLADADATLDRLQAAYGSDEPRLVPTVTPWRIYTRAKVYEAAGEQSSGALARAFSELYGSLPDIQAAGVLPWYGVNLDGLRSDEAKQEKVCEG